MRITRSLEDLGRLGINRSVVTIGVFDGVHLGHRKIIESLVDRAKSDSIETSVLMTFYPHPLTVTHSKIAPPILSTTDERIELLSAFPLDVICVIPFTAKIAEMDYRDFIKIHLLGSLGMRHLVIGYDFHLGRDRGGSPARLGEEASRAGFGLTVVGPVKRGGVVISSTQIRNEIMGGDLEDALELLGHPYPIKGKVVRGHGKGHSLGFPTANLAVEDPYKLWPSRGVYAVTAKMGAESYGGMMNVGSSPTMKRLEAGTREIEVHLFDFDGEIYEREMTVYCHSYMRAEKKFTDPEALASQLRIDRDRARELLAKKTGYLG